FPAAHAARTRSATPAVELHDAPHRGRASGEFAARAARLELAPQVHEQRHAGAVDHLNVRVVDLHPCAPAAAFEQFGHALPECGRLLDRHAPAELDARPVVELDDAPG